jgi:ABC-2 type transport system permease protein
MTIREKGYHHWDGELLAPRFRWMPILLSGIKSVWKKKYIKSGFSFTLMPFLVFLVGIWVLAMPQMKMFIRAFPRELEMVLTKEAMFFQEFSANGFIVFMLVILGVTFGADLISGDIKFNSFPLYFSRPLDRKDYIAGKFSIILFFYLLLTLAPGYILYIFKFIFHGKIAPDPHVLIGLTAVPILMSFLIASIVLMVSSLSGNAKFVKAGIFMIYFASDILANILHEITKDPHFHLISLKSNVIRMGSFFFNTDPRWDYPGWLSLLAVLAISAGSFLIIYKRIGKAEAQIESGN